MVLQTIRERLTGLLAVLILGILVIPFAFVGINQYFVSDAQNLVARVGDTEITLAEFNQSFQNYRRRMQAQLGEGFDAEAFDQPVIRRQHLESLIDEALLRQVAEQLDFEVDDARLAEEIRNISVFQVNGQFNPDVYQSRLLAQGLTPRQFEQDVRASFIVSQLPAAIAASSIATASELREAVRLQEQKRDFRAVRFDVTEADRAYEPTEEEITAYFEANSDDFMSPEQVVIEYLEIDAADMVPTVAPDEALLRARFEQQEARFIAPEQRQASHILIEVPPAADEATVEAARQRAQELAEEVRGGADIAELAREFSDDQGSAPAGGDLGWIEPGFMVPAFEEALYQLTTENPVSDAVRTGFGWHVIELRDIQPATGMSFEEARETLEREYAEEEAERAYLEEADRLVDMIYEDPTTLESASLAMNLPVQETEPFDRSGGPGIAADPEVVEAAFSDLVLLQRSVSDPIQLEDNHMVMIHLKEHREPALRPLDEVREEIVATLVDEAAKEAARSRAETFLAELEAGGDPRALAEAQGVEWAFFDAATRRSADIDPVLLGEVFALPAQADALTPATGNAGEDEDTAADAVDANGPGDAEAESGEEATEAPESDTSVDGDASSPENADETVNDEATPDENAGEADEPVLAEALERAVLPTADGYAVVAITGVTAGALDPGDALRRQAYRRQMATSVAVAEADMLITQLRAATPVEIFDERL